MLAAVPKKEIPPLRQPVISLRGVGPERAALLARLEVYTIEDLLLHRPRRYEDRRHLRPIADLTAREAATARGKIVALGVKWFAHHTKSIFEMILDDGTARLHCRWWNLPYMERYFAQGNEVVVFGKLLGLKPRTMDHPETEIIEGGEESFIHLNRITPIYPLTEGLPQRWVRSLIWRTLEQFEGQIPEPWPRPLLPAGNSTGQTGSNQEATLQSANLKLHRSPELPSRAEAIRMLHFPEVVLDTEPARRRLALDEFIELQMQIQARRRNFETKAQALPCRGDNHLIRPFLGALGFKLTEAQTKVLRELRQDLSGLYPMRRLLQGDVGCGKTVVAACCALMALESGYNVALMAPNEILADQHFRNFSIWFGPLKIGVEMQTGSQKTFAVHGPQSTARSPKVASGGHTTATNRQAALFVGTHALLTEGFNLPNLGLVIIDEQHKFGVARTLGLTLYGELDVSVIDELPRGRGRIHTFVRTSDKLPQVWTFIRQKLAAGRQAYVVYPRVEETEQNGLKAVTKELSNVEKALKPFRVGLLHGRLRSAEKEQVMSSFRANRLQVLLATSLIEVGVDVPNATILLVENAEQFGLAQLHQLRGRIGRGAHESFCILVATARSKEARERLRALEETTDGFEIAETDLRLRGPGELLGQQQSGMPKFRFGDLAQDLELIKEARQVAAGLVRPV
jgi:ATP-dependent DNA helicase RecG